MAKVGKARVDKLGGSQLSVCISVFLSPHPSSLPSSSSSPTPPRREIRGTKNVTWRPVNFSPCTLESRGDLLNEEF